MKKLFILIALGVALLLPNLVTKAYYLSAHVENIYNYVPDYQNPLTVEFEGVDMDLFFSGALYDEGAEVSDLATLTSVVLDNYPVGWSSVVLFPLSLGSTFWTSSTDSIKQLAYIIYLKSSIDTVVLSFYNLDNQLVFSGTNLYLDSPSVYYPKTANVQYEFQKGYDKGYFDGYEDGIYTMSKQSYDEGYDYGYNLGYNQGYNKGFEVGAEYDPVSWLKAVIFGLNSILAINFGGVTLGAILIVPFALRFVPRWLGIFKKGGSE